MSMYLFISIYSVERQLLGWLVLIFSFDTSERIQIKSGSGCDVAEDWTILFQAIDGANKWVLSA